MDSCQCPSSSQSEHLNQPRSSYLDFRTDSDMIRFLRWQILPLNLGRKTYLHCCSPMGNCHLSGSVLVLVFRRGRRPTAKEVKPKTKHSSLSDSLSIDDSALSFETSSSTPRYRQPQRTLSSAMKLDAATYPTPESEHPYSVTNSHTAARLLPTRFKRSQPRSSSPRASPFQ